MRNAAHSPADAPFAAAVPACLTALLLAAPLLLTGCDDDRIHAYLAPPDAPKPEAPAVTTVPRPEAATENLTWDVPEGWTDAADPPGFVLAAYDAGGRDSKVLATVSRLAGAGGGGMANINRWRGQVGLPPVKSLEEQAAEPLQINGEPAGLFDLAGEPDSGKPAERIVAVIFPRLHVNETWFFKLSGPADAVEEQKAAFVEMVRSTRREPTDEEPTTVSAEGEAAMAGESSDEHPPHPHSHPHPHPEGEE